MPNGTNSRLHIKKQLDNGVEINVFGDNPADVVQLISHVIALCEGYYPDQPAKPTQPAQLSPSLGAQPAATSLRPATPIKPVCPDCGSDATVHLVSFKHRETGQTMSRFKCQDCNKWLGKKV